MARGFENEIVSLTGILDLAERMQEIGVRVRTLGMKTTLPNPLLVMRLASGFANRNQTLFTPGCITRTWLALSRRAWLVMYLWFGDPPQRPGPAH